MNLLWVITKSVCCTPEQIWQETCLLLPWVYHLITSARLCFIDVSVVAYAPFFVISNFLVLSFLVLISPSAFQNSPLFLLLGALCLCCTSNAFHRCGCTCSICAEVIPNKITVFLRLILEACFWFPGWYFLIQHHLGLSAAKPAPLSAFLFLCQSVLTSKSPCAFWSPCE